MLIRFNSDTAAWMTFLVTLGGIQTRLHLIKQEQTEGKLHLVMEMDLSMQSITCTDLWKTSVLVLA